LIGTMIVSSTAMHIQPVIRLAVVLLALSIFNTLAAQGGKFPSLEGETVNGERVTLPISGGKPHTLVGIAFSQKASPLLEEWYEPAYLRFVAKHGLFAGAYDAHVYFVPLFVGVNKTAYDPSMRKFRKSASPEIVDHVLFSKAEFDPLREALDLDDKNVPYFFVLDGQGRIIHRSKGRYSVDKLDAMEEVLLD
jgi:hypothetical protein